jgi:hypothetical protein
MDTTTENKTKAQESFLLKLKTMGEMFNELSKEAVALLWTKRSYEARSEIQCESVKGGETHATMKTVTLVPAGEYANVTFGTDYKVPGTEVFDLPETIQTRFGIEHDFHVESLSINDEDAPHFVIGPMFLGQRKRSAWRFDVEIAGSKFATSATPVLKLNQDIGGGLTVSLRVRNTSDVARPFRAKVLGREKLST